MFSSYFFLEFISTYSQNIGCNFDIFLQNFFLGIKGKNIDEFEPSGTGSGTEFAITTVDVGEDYVGAEIGFTPKGDKVSISVELVDINREDYRQIARLLKPVTFREDDVSGMRRYVKKVIGTIDKWAETGNRNSLIAKEVTAGGLTRTFSKRGSGTIVLYWQMEPGFGYFAEVKKAFGEVERAANKEWAQIKSIAGRSSQVGEPRVYLNHKTKTVMVGTSVSTGYGEDKEALNELLLEWQRFGL